MPTRYAARVLEEWKITACTGIALGRWAVPVSFLLLPVLGCEGEIAPIPPAPGSSGGLTASGGGSGNPGATGGSGGQLGSGSSPSQGGSSPGGSMSVAGGGGGAALGGSSSGGQGTGGTGVGGTPDLSKCVQPTATRAPLRRITRFEYNNTVRDLLGITSKPADALPGEEAGSGFGNDADALGVSRLLIDGYRAVAQQVAQQVTANSAAVIALTGCDPAAIGEDKCQQQFLTDYLTRAFRRPPDADDLSAYKTAFSQGKTLGGNFASGARAVVERSLQSAQFLYRVEVGQPVDATRNLARPTGFEMATRLSYLLWGSMPDKALRDAAAQGKLDTKEGVLSEARRLLADDHAKDSLRYFHAQLLGVAGLDHLERDAGFYPTFKPGMGSLFRQETEQFLDYVVWKGAGNLATVFTAPYTFVNGPLATFYGIPNVSGDAFQMVTLDATRRAGLLTQASVLTITTPGSRNDPVVRGKWLYTKMLCGFVPDPPQNVPKLPDPVPGQSVRERLAMHRADSACAGCHTLMDPMGLPFEHFDGVGLWRDTDNGAPIDDSGQIPTTDVAGPFNGALEFGQKLARSHDVRTCYAGRYLTYAYGRTVAAEDGCNRAVVENAFETAQGSIKDLMVAVTQTDGFLFRPLNAP